MNQFGQKKTKKSLNPRKKMKEQAKIEEFYQSLKNINSFKDIREIEPSKKEVSVAVSNNSFYAMLNFKKYPKIENATFLNNKTKFIENEKWSKEILHLINDKEINIEEEYEIFVDGSLKEYKDKIISSCSCWCRVPKKYPVLEFAKELNLNIEEKNCFEIKAILEAVKLIKKYNIKNAIIYTDSRSEALMLNLKFKGVDIGNSHKSFPYYQEIIELMNEINLNIVYISRKYNKHADRISKIYFKEEDLVLN